MKMNSFLKYSKNPPKSTKSLEMMWCKIQNLRNKKKKCVQNLKHIFSYQKLRTEKIFIAFVMSSPFLRQINQNLLIPAFELSPKRNKPKYNENISVMIKNLIKFALGLNE